MIDSRWELSLWFGGNEQPIVSRLWLFGELAAVGDFLALATRYFDLCWDAKEAHRVLLVASQGAGQTKESFVITT